MTDNGNTATKPVTAAQWKKQRDHLVRLPSGVHVTLRVPDLPALIEAGEIPQHLLEAAIGIATGDAPKPSKEMVVQQREFTDALVRVSVVEPKLSEEDLKDIPFEDKDMIVAIATRQTDLDAEGHHIAGLHKSKDWRSFRGFTSINALLEDD